MNQKNVQIKKTLGQQTEDQLMKYILDNQISIGSKIPNEFELAQMFHVGRSTVREAVKGLISRGILEVRRGDGTYVISTVYMENDVLGFGQIKDRYQLALDLFDVRLMIEPEIAALAALRATREQVEKIEEYAKEVEELFNQGKPYLEKDILFHAEIARATGNQVTTNLMPVIQSGISLFIDVTDYSIANKTIVTHREVLEAIKRHDPQGASEAMKRHLENNRVQIKSLMKKME